jgi:copper resistance protein B
MPACSYVAALLLGLMGMWVAHGAEQSVGTHAHQAMKPMGGGERDPPPLLREASASSTMTREAIDDSGERPVPPGYWPGAGWPSPVDDDTNNLYVLFDILEYRPTNLLRSAPGNSGQAGSNSNAGGENENPSYWWDMEGWYGGDYNRLWFKSEGQQDSAFKADYDIDFQLLYGRFIRKYYDFQIGGRVEAQTYRGASVARGLLTIGIEGLVPYDYDIEALAFVAQNGAVSARVTLTKDLLLTQQLIVQLRIEGNAAIQRVPSFTVGSGFNELELGFRVRYEFWREFAPYVGFSYGKSFGETAAFVSEQGGNPEQLRLVSGLRLWF